MSTFYMLKKCARPVKYLRLLGKYLDNYTLEIEVLLEKENTFALINNYKFFSFSKLSDYCLRYFNHVALISYYLKQEYLINKRCSNQLYIKAFSS